MKWNLKNYKEPKLRKGVIKRPCPNAGRLCACPGYCNEWIDEKTGEKVSQFDIFEGTGEQT